MATDVEAILAEMKDIGAVGASKPQPQPVVAEEVVVEEVEVEQASPGPVLKDARGSQMVGLLDSVIHQLEVLQATFQEMRQVWQTEDVMLPAAGRADRILEKARSQLGKAPAPQSARGPLPDDKEAQPSQPAAISAEEARERAVAKVRGGDHSDPATFKDPDDDEDGDPYVGYQRAMPPSQEEKGEVTLRSIPVNGKGD